MLKKVASAGAIAAMSCLAFVAVPVSASETTPEEACLFFFEMEGPTPQASREGRTLRNMELGNSMEAPLGIPRYTRIIWQNGIVEELFRRGVDNVLISGGAIAFELQCLVDLTEKRVMKISIQSGQRVAEILTIDGLDADSVTPATGANPRSVSLHTTLMQGLY